MVEHYGPGPHPDGSPQSVHGGGGTKSLPTSSGRLVYGEGLPEYPLDLGHNFVVAHQKCNSAKADHLAAADYLAAWVERNIQYGSGLGNAFNQRGVLHDLPTSVRIANWAYQQTFDANGLTWESGNDMVPLAPDWDRIANCQSHQCYL